LDKESNYSQYLETYKDEKDKHDAIVNENYKEMKEIAKKYPKCNTVKEKIQKETIAHKRCDLILEESKASASYGDGSVANYLDKYKNVVVSKIKSHNYFMADLRMKNYRKQLASARKWLDEQIEMEIQVDEKFEDVENDLEVDIEEEKNEEDEEIHEKGDYLLNLND